MTYEGIELEQYPDEWQEVVRERLDQLPTFGPEIFTGEFVDLDGDEYDHIVRGEE